MTFTSIIFLCVFLPLSVIVYYLLPQKIKNLGLVLFSFLFYWWGADYYVLLLLAVIAINYVVGVGLDHLKSKTIYRKGLFFIGITGNLLPLLYYKYYDFFIENLDFLFKRELPLKGLIVPLGLSFYAFQGVSYLFDVYRQEVTATKNPLDVALYISFFPKITQGPIEKYTDFVGQVHKRSLDIDQIYNGIIRFSIGLGKKVLIADSMGIVVDKIYARVGAIDTPTAWFGAFLYMMQLYFDFSGYTDMAIGIGSFFGFTLPENFNYPYISSSISEFWRRWHISLSTWFKNYLYIPLGGNRRGNVYFNLFLVFLTTGLWHGANYTFLIWGLWHGFFIIIEKILRKKGKDKDFPWLIRWVIAQLVVYFGWILFRADNIYIAKEYIETMFGIRRETQNIQYSFLYYANKKMIVLSIIAIILSTPLIKSATLKMKDKKGYKIIQSLLSIALLIISMIFMISSSYSPFLYFQF